MAFRTELSVRLPNTPGALKSLCRVLADERVDIVAMMLESNGQLRLVVDNHTRAAATLRAHHHQVHEQSVIATNVPDTPGAMADVLGLLASSGTNLDYAYGGAGSGGSATVVIGVSDPMRAAAAAGL
jgi:hypothetical protein